MKEKLKKTFTLSNILSLISILLNTYILNLILKLDIIPAKYMLLLAGIIYIFNILFIVFTKMNKKLVRVIGYIFSGLYTLFAVSSTISAFFTIRGTLSLALSINSTLQL